MYLSKHGRGFVSVGRVTDRAKPAREFRPNGKLLIDYPDRPKGARENLRTRTNASGWQTVNWIASVPRAKAHFKGYARLFTPALVRALLAKQPLTVKFINGRFGINLFKLADESVMRQRAAILPGGIQAKNSSKGIRRREAASCPSCGPCAS